MALVNLKRCLNFQWLYADKRADVRCRLKGITLLQTPRLSVLYVIILGFALAHCGSGYFDWRSTRKSDPRGANAVTVPAGNSAAFQNAMACGASYSPGHAALHLLSTEEYNRTAADLLFTSSKASDLAIFEAAPKGTTGFATDTGNFAMTDLTVTKYWNAATALADELLRSKGQGGAYAQIAGCAIGQSPVPQSCYQKVVLTLGQRAWRRPIAAGSDGDESSRLLAIMNGAGTFDDGLKALIQALMISPNFLFVSVTSPQSTTAGAAFALDQFQLASRLSYYLWGSMPDNELFSAAADGKLADAANIGAQVDRMLASPRAAHLANNIINDWVGIDNLSNIVTPSLPESVKGSMAQETQRLIQDIVSSNSSLMNMTSAAYSFLNKELADLYSLPFPGADPKAFVKVDLSATPRRGVLSQAAFLLVSAGSTSETRPVKRGHALASNWTCSDVAPPPPNVPAINSAALPPNSTPKQVLAVHGSNPSCASCHRVLDPLGIGMESFDSYGRWRTTYAAIANVPIDASGTLADGTAISGTADMIKYLASSQTVKTCVARKMMEMALSRVANATDDLCVAKSTGTSGLADGSKFSDLVKAVVLSRQFGLQNGEAP